MDIRGPAESHKSNNHLSHVQKDIVRFESEGKSLPAKGPQFSMHTAAPEIAPLVRELQALPEVREELVQQAMAKLSSGDYLTRKSAEQTADAILRLTSEE